MANNSKFDSQLSRMQYLMGYKVPINEAKTSSKVEYFRPAADGKVYGILKEGSMYYIKTTEKGKEKLAESYEYIGGYNYRNENGYKSYNEATKQFELKMMSLNEAHKKHEDVSVFDTNRGRKNLATLTEAARKEIDRMHQIFENSGTIGKNNTGDPESKGKATAEQTTKNNAPFEEKAEATLDKDPKFNATVESATPDNKKVDGVEKDLESDAMKTKKVETAEEPKDAHDDLEGTSVADQKPKGAKAVKMNEGLEFGQKGVTEDDDALVGADDDFEEEELSDEMLDDTLGDGGMEDPVVDLNTDTQVVDNEPIVDDTIVDTTVDGADGSIEDGAEEVSLYEEMDQLLKEFEETEKAMHGEEKSVESKIVGPDKVMDGPHGGLDVQGWNDEKVNEAVSKIAESVAKNLCCKDDKCDCDKKDPKKKKKETIQEAIDRIVAEEITRLNVWGQHPKYGKQPMTTPANKEVLAGTADKDWNDDSTKGEKPYGQKIGKGDPFEKAVNMAFDSVKSKIQEGQKSKKA